MTSAFISYSRRDELVARYLARVLSDRGVDVFIDVLNLRAGNFFSQLGAEIRKRQFFIVLLSQHAARSKWVTKEVAWAFIVKREENILPIMVAPLSEHDWESLFVLVAFQRIDLTQWPRPDGFSQGIAKLEAYMGLPSRPPVPVPRVEPFEEIEEREGAEEGEEPLLSVADILRLLNAAESIQSETPLRALYLLREAATSLQHYVSSYERKVRGHGPRSTRDYH